jgi:sulfhydrogenase subunit beta (sulfur reductase)
MAPSHQNRHWLLPKAAFDDLLRLLAGQGYEVIGPRLEQGAIIYDTLGRAADLPAGWTDRQAPGQYRLQKRDDQAWFAFAVGPHSWKKYLFPPTLVLWRARRDESGLMFAPAEYDPPKRALLGARSCELHAIAIQDRVFMNHQSGFVDPHYAKARQRLLLIAVECQAPAETCFCTSMGTGPAVEPDRIPLLASEHRDGARQAGGRGAMRLPLPIAVAKTDAPPACDLILTELEDAFVVGVGSPAGVQIVKQLKLRPATKARVDQARRGVSAAAKAMERRVEVKDIRGLLHRNQENPRWDDVSNRCLACTNCTLVCPTCFCSAVEDHSDLALETAERVRRWDSCFAPEFARVAGGNFRPSVRGRYRQWLTHKFASWFDQFGVSGCVGCGRCITWCPVGIDVTEELAALRASDGQRAESRHDD